LLSEPVAGDRAMAGELLRPTDREVPPSLDRCGRLGAYPYESVPMRSFLKSNLPSSLLASALAIAFAPACASGEESSSTEDGGGDDGDLGGPIGGRVGAGGETDSSAGGMTPGSGGGTTSAGGSSDGGEIFGETRSGEATYYDATGEGACTFDASPDDLMVAALNSPDWSGSAWCGACAQVSGPKGQVVVRIVDLCPECNTGDLDLSPQAFDQIAEREQGRVAVAWTYVSCPTSGPVRYRFKDGAHQYWTAVQVHNHALPIELMEWSKDGSSWTVMPREDYNYFLEADGFGEGSSFVRITATDGQQLVDELPAVQEYLVVDGVAQFE
jgi:expansin (peptidoglycan-binding protein)